MERIIGCCGIVCSECIAFKATQSGDSMEQEKVVETWRREYHSPGLTVASIQCDGCPPQGERHCYHCDECDIRACGLAHKVQNCAYCIEYSCERLTRFHGSVPDARTVLDAIRTTGP